MNVHTLLLSGNQLTLEDVVQVSAGQVSVRLSKNAYTAITQSRQIIEAVLKSDKVVYGVNTGFGALSSVRISDDQLQQLQINLVRSHAAGTGKPLSIPVVRAMMLLRANTLAKGFSGVRPLIIETLLDMLNTGVYPIIPCQGSLGASGDLAPLAHMAQVMMGEGFAYYKDESMTGSEAMAQAGIPTVCFEAKEGLALLNGTQMMTAVGVLTLAEAEQLMEVAELAGAMTIEAVRGSHRPFDARIAETRPHPGQIESAQRLRALLNNSEIQQDHLHCEKVQDAYSLRCIPQVHGAVRELLSAVRKTLTIEINASTDNPLIFPNGDIISQGNFHGEPVAMAMEQLALALCELGSISERRLDKIMNPVFSGLPAFLAAGQQAGLNSGMMIVHYTAASLVSENKGLAHPAVVDSIPTSNDKEDHVSMGAIAARKAQSILTNVQWVIAAELLAAAEGLEHRNGLKPGDGVWKAYQLIRKNIPALTQDRSLAKAVEQLVGMIKRNMFLS